LGAPSFAVGGVGLFQSYPHLGELKLGAAFFSILVKAKNPQALKGWATLPEALRT
jgi:hypothetical protein